MVLNVKSGINLYKKKKIKVINGFMIATKNPKYFVFFFPLKNRFMCFHSRSSLRPYLKVEGS